MKNLISDTQTLISAKSRSDNPIPIYDDGSGPLFIHRDSMGISGIVRADTWEDAYGICEDEFFPEASETIEEIQKEYNVHREHVKIIKPLDGGPERPVTPEDYNPKLTGQFVRWETVETPCDDCWHENELFQEAFGFRPSGPRAGKWENGEPRDPIGHGIYAKDLNGYHLDLLTPELLKELEITLEISEEEEA